MSAGLKLAMLAGLTAVLAAGDMANAVPAQLKVKCSATSYQNRFGRWIVLICDPGYLGALAQFTGSGDYYSGWMQPLYPRAQQSPLLYPGGAVYHGKAFPPPPSVDCFEGLETGMGSQEEALVCDEP